jgi:TonB-linked SusC/RagA family outer membrane protein
MYRSLVRCLLGTALAATALALGARPAWAQPATLAGRITAAGQPLGGASVGIPELSVGTTTDEQGRFSFNVDVTRAKGRAVVLIARQIGYKPQRATITLTAGRTERNFELVRDVLNLEQVVVTGVSDATSQKKTTFAIAQIDNSQLKEAPSVTPLGGLNGRVAGASVTAVSGSPGSAPQIKLRGATSLTGSQEPLIIIDGTIARISLADINSEDIERIEVIKGAAASSLYGSDAANGVVQIFTKRGANLAEGQTSITVRNEIGSSDLRRTLPNNLSHNFQLTSAGAFVRDANGNRVTKADGISDQPYPETFDQLGQVFKPGNFLTSYVSVAQRKGAANFNASFQNTQDNGVITGLNGFSRQNFRLNLDMALSDKIDIQTGAFYGNSNADQTNENSFFFGLRFLEPNVDLTAPNRDGTPFNAAIRQPPLSGNVVNPLYLLNRQEVDNARNRFTGTGKIRYRPLSWLTAEGNVNFDRAAEQFKQLVPIGYTNSSGARNAGSLFQQNNGTRAYNLGATLTATKALTSWMTNTTKLAWVYEDQENTRFQLNATALTVPRVPEFTAASRDPNNPLQPASFTRPIRNQNYFAVTTFDIKDRYIIDALIRQDQSSLFGPENRSRNFKRISGAYRFSEDIKLPGIDDLKFRASYGEAGLRPIFDAQYETFSVVGGAPVKQRLGNPLLKPAFSRETEAGFNVNFLKNFTFEYSYSSKITSDQILNVPVSSAAGFTSTWTNAGTLAGQTHEFLIGAVLAQKKNFFWRLNVAGDRTRQQITRLDVPAFLVGPDPDDANTRIFRIAQGETFGVLYGDRWIRNEAQLATTIQARGLTGTTADYVLNEEGFFVRRADWRTVRERPLKATNADGTTLTQIGDVNPDINLAFNTQMNYKTLSVTAVLNWVQGGDIYNYTRQWPFNEQRDPIYDQRNKTQVERKPAAYYQTFYNNFGTSDFFVENGSFVRLRELAVNWQLPGAVMRKVGMANRTARLGVVGRNLFTSTDYSGYDPDVAGPGGGNPFAYRVDYFTYPVFKTFTAMIELGF